MFLTVLIFIAILGLLVFVHELGHFVVAKKSGMQVDEFGFGFPPRLFGIQKLAGKWKAVWHRRASQSASAPPPDTGQEAALWAPSAQRGATIYSINWIPLGGFVRILGENNQAASDPNSFINKPFWPRLLTLLAGVLMNLVLAWLLLSAGYIKGLPVALDGAGSLPAQAVLTNQQVAILEVAPNSPAALAGIQAGDIILGVDGREFSSAEALRQYVLLQAGREFRFELKRINQNLSAQVASRKQPQAGEGPTGIALGTLGLLSYPWYQAFWQGAQSTLLQLGQIVSGLYHLIIQGQGLQSLGGPVKIAQITGQVRELGFIYLVQFAAFLSINLAVLNVLPFPALDGGRILFLLIEKLRRKRNNQKVEQIVNTAGFVFLLLLMLLVTARDIKGLWR